MCVIIYVDTWSCCVGVGLSNVVLLSIVCGESISSVFANQCYEKERLKNSKLRKLHITKLQGFGSRLIFSGSGSRNNKTNIKLTNTKKQHDFLKTIYTMIESKRNNLKIVTLHQCSCPKYTTYLSKLVSCKIFIISKFLKKSQLKQFWSECIIKYKTEFC